MGEANLSLAKLVLAALIALGLASGVAAQQSPDVEIIHCPGPNPMCGLLGAPEPVTYPKFDTAELAAIAALKQIADHHGGYYEWGGMIAKTQDGKYAFTAPSTDYEGDNVTIRRDLPPDMEVVGGYHTHPCLPQHDVEFFSPEDLMAVIWGHQPMEFMGDFCTGNVHQFKLGDQPDTVATHGIWLTKGRIIGKFTTSAAVPSE
jgi:hypothetical protein